MTPVEIRVRRSARVTRDRVWGRLGVNRVPRIAGLAVSRPDGATSQDEVLARLGLRGDPFAEGIFERCGVHTRNLRLDDEFLASNLQGRMALVEDELLAEAIGLIDELGAARRPLGTVLTSSLYSLGCPSLAHRLVEHYALPPATDKYHLTGIGCASAVPLLRLAAQALHRHPSRDVLVVAAESMSSILMPAGPDAGGPRPSARRSSATAARSPSSPTTRRPQAPRSSAPRSITSAARSTPSACAPTTATATCTSRASSPSSPPPTWRRCSTPSCTTGAVARSHRPLARAPGRPAHRRERA